MTPTYRAVLLTFIRLFKCWKVPFWDLLTVLRGFSTLPSTWQWQDVFSAFWEKAKSVARLLGRSTLRAEIDKNLKERKSCARGNSRVDRKEEGERKKTEKNLSFPIVCVSSCKRQKQDLHALCVPCACACPQLTLNDSMTLNCAQVRTFPRWTLLIWFNYVVGTPGKISSMEVKSLFQSQKQKKKIKLYADWCA